MVTRASRNLRSRRQRLYENDHPLTPEDCDRIIDRVPEQYDENVLAIDSEASLYSEQILQSQQENSSSLCMSLSTQSSTACNSV
jgi:hypothetical protein